MSDGVSAQPLGGAAQGAKAAMERTAATVLDARRVAAQIQPVEFPVQLRQGGVKAPRRVGQRRATGSLGDDAFPIQMVTPSGNHPIESWYLRHEFRRPKAGVILSANHNR